jgi:hypothetical protein
MKTQDLFNIKAEKINESMLKTFGQQIDLASFDAAKLEDARNKLRTQIHTARNSAEFNENLENDAFYKAQFMLDAINKELSEREDVAINGLELDESPESKENTNKEEEMSQLETSLATNNQKLLLKVQHLLSRLLLKHLKQHVIHLQVQHAH